MSVQPPAGYEFKLAKKKRENVRQNFKSQCRDHRFRFTHPTPNKKIHRLLFHV